MKILRRILWTGLALSLIVFLAAFLFYFSVTKNTRLYPEKLILSEKNITVYDKNDEPVNVSSIPSLKQTVAISQIPKHTQLAFVDTEDKRFFSHNGFDVRRIVKAALNNLRAGSFKEGASTISQQLIKNTHLSQEKTVKRKLKEWKLTRRLEKKYSKAEILEKYLNTIYFGHSCFGIRSAAEFYFNKTPAELTLADSVILAGLVKSPNNYSPFKNPENCKRRMESVLNAMLVNKHITKQEKQAALNAPLPTQNTKSTQNIGYVNFLFDELSALSETHGFQVGGNIEIYTYLDENLQAELEKLAKTETNSDKTMLVLDTETLGFKGCVSSVGNIRRLPGSLIKPLLVYTPALEEDILSPATPILDEKVNYNGYSPENYDGVYHGYVSARECVEKSLNIPAVKTLETLGTGKGAEYLKKLGLPVEKEDLSLALALGGMKNGFTLKDILSAYSTLACQGNFCEGAFISKIKINGTTVYERSVKKKSVFSEETAYLMTDMLKSTAKTGTAKKLRSLPFDIAAKTGTVGTQQGNTDAYALSYTTKDCVAVWLGNADNSRIEYTGGGVPCNFLMNINEYLYDAYQAKDIRLTAFSKPKNVQSVSLDKTTYYDTHNMILADENAPVEYRITELFKKSAIPLKQSTLFSCPSIESPLLSFENGKVYITFDKNSPSYYQYKIDRYDYATHTTVYFGDNPKLFEDGNLQNGKTYVYTVTPVYKGNFGVSVPLPSITTKQGDAPKNNDEILKKEWWEY